MTIGRLGSPRRLERGDDRSSFSSGAAELDEWLRRYAWQDQQANNAVTYVATYDGTVLGYHAIAAAGVSRDDVPSEFGRQRPSDIPCVLLARLAVDTRAQGRGLGAALFLDAVRRSISASEAIGAACLLIHCRDEAARDFYLRHADLLDSPVDPLHLVLPMKAARSVID